LVIGFNLDIRDTGEAYGGAEIRVFACLRAPNQTAGSKMSGWEESAEEVGGRVFESLNVTVISSHKRSGM
jgi:hypothetical protein